MITKARHQIISFLPALRSANYRLYFIGYSISLIGSWFAAIAEQWLIYPTLTNDQSMVGISYMANLIPTALLVLFSGVIIDRIDKRKATIIFQALYAIIVFILFLLIVTHHIQIWHILLATFLSGIIFAFESTARMSLVIELVDRKDLASALSLNGALFNSARAIGAALAGVFIAAFGIPLTYLANALSFLAVIFSLLNIKTTHHAPPEDIKSYKKEFLKGWLYILSHREILVLLSIVLTFSFFVFSTATLLSIFAHDVFKRGEVGFGFLQSFLGVGAMTSGLLFSKLYEKTKDKFRLMIIGIVIASISGLLFALSNNFTISLVLILMGGYAGSMVIASTNTTVQINLPIELRGRVISFFTFCLLGGMAFGSLIVALIVKPLGPHGTYFVLMLGFSIVSFLILFLNRKLLEEKMNRA